MPGEEQVQTYMPPESVFRRSSGRSSGWADRLGPSSVAHGMFAGSMAFGFDPSDLDNECENIVLTHDDLSHDPQKHIDPYCTIYWIVRVP